MILDHLTKIPMNDEGYKKTTLSIYRSSEDAGNDVVSRVLKKKGEMAILSVDPNSFIAYVEFSDEGEPRANHYHEEKIEHLYLIKGRIKLFIRKGGDNHAIPKEITINAGEMITIYPWYAHAYVTLEEGFAIEFSPTSYNEIIQDKIRDFVVRQ